MKIIHIISDSNIGGAGVWLLTFLKNYDREQHEIEVFLPENASLIPDIADIGVKYTEIPHIDNKSFSFPAVKELKTLLRERRPDIIHTHAAFSARVAARLAGGIKIVYTRHTITPSKKLVCFPLKQLNGVFNNLFADEIIAVSPAVIANLNSVGVKGGKINLVYNGVTPIDTLCGDTKKTIRAKYGIPEDAFLVALIGRMIKFKRHDTAIDAAHLLSDGNIFFIFPGTGDALNQIHEKIQNLGLDNIILPGFIKDIHEIENIMDIQINTSFDPLFEEATSMSLLEGMSLGKPAVVNDAGGNPYVIEDGVNGLVVPAGDHKALAAAILKIKGDKTIHDTLSKGAVKIYTDKFTAKRMVEETFAVYTRSLEGL